MGGRFLSFSGLPNLEIPYIQISEPRAGLLPHAPSTQGTMNHVALWVEDLPEVKRKLEMWRKFYGHEVRTELEGNNLLVRISATTQYLELIALD